MTALAISALFFGLTHLMNPNASWFAAICIAIGLFTRFFAAAIAIELLIAMLAAHWAKGFSVGAGGYEYVLFLGIVMFAIALRGGGPYSVDRLIGKEL